VSRARKVSGQLSLLVECLDERDRAVLSFAGRHHLQGRVQARAQQELRVNPTRYFQLLAAMLRRPEVQEAEPELVGRLRALQEQRQRARAQARAAEV